MKLNKNKVFLSLVLLGLMLLGVVNKCWAQDCGGSCGLGYTCVAGDEGDVCVPTEGVNIGSAFKLKDGEGIWTAAGYDSLGTFISSSIIPNVMMIANVILFVLILGAGFTIITSAGNPDKQKQASQTLTASILGFVIIFAAYWIMQILGIITGVELLNMSTT